MHLLEFYTRAQAVMLPIWLYFAYLHGRAFEAPIFLDPIDPSDVRGGVACNRQD